MDALGNPLKVSLTKGQVHDITEAETLTADITSAALLADKGYDADGFIQPPCAQQHSGDPAKIKSLGQT